MKFSLAALEEFATKIYLAAGLDVDKARSTAHLQVLTDAFGRRTHGLAMLPLYIEQIDKGLMTKTGEPNVIKQREVASVWDGRYLPGLWLVTEAIARLKPSAQKHGMAAIAIQQSHHIGCLAALSYEAACEGFIVQIYNSDPSGARVAPFGGKQALFTPNPMSIAYPAADHPVLVDICASTTTTSMTRQKHAAGQLFDHPWLLDAQGQPTRDPAVLEHREPRGSLQLLGGQDAGHKGFGQALMNEALSQGLSGHGRAQKPKRWGGNVFVQLIDPQAFAGADAFAMQVNHLANACRSNPAIDASQPVRLPGDQAAARLEQAQREGLQYEANTWQALIAIAKRFHIPALTA